MLTRDQIMTAMARWGQAWNSHDLDGVMEFFHDEAAFENWTGGRAVGREAIRRAWSGWFADHGGFRFTTEDLFVDEAAQKVLYQWRLDWPSTEKGYEGRPEARRGVDVLHFKDGRIIRKDSYSKTTLEIGGQRVKLAAGGS